MFLKPYAFRIITLILLFIDSIRALDNPWCTVAIIASLCLLIFLLNFTNTGILHLHDHDSHLSNSCSTFSFPHWKTNLNPSFNWYPLNSIGYRCFISSNLFFWYGVKFSGFFPNGYFAPFIEGAFFTTSSPFLGRPFPRFGWLLSFF